MKYILFGHHSHDCHVYMRHCVQTILHGMPCIHYQTMIVLSAESDVMREQRDRIVRSVVCVLLNLILHMQHYCSA